MTDKYIPSFWVSEEYSGCTLREYITYALKRRDRDRFDLQMHRGGGWKGSGKCEQVDCKACPILKELGV